MTLIYRITLRDTVFNVLLRYVVSVRLTTGLSVK